jgi:cytochrome c oxidase subunit 2
MAFALVAALLLVTIGCIYLFVVHPWWFPAGVSAYAASVDHEFSTAFWLLGGLFVVAQAALAAFILRAWRKKKPSYYVGNWRLEVGWTLAIAALFFWFHFSGARVWSSMRLHDPEPQALRVEVTGAQFQWYFRYPGPDGTWGRTDAQKFARPDEGNPLGIDFNDSAGKDDIVSSTLVLPVNRDIDLTLRAQDVIHSLFIPAMRFKQDTVPGMDVHAHLKPLQTGKFEIVCSQLCGLGHYRMKAIAQVVTEEEFKEWLKKHESPRMSANRP